MVSQKALISFPSFNYERMTDALCRLTSKVCIDATTFHEPKTFLHKVEKALMLETDVSETPNEMIWLVKKMGRVGLIGVYTAYTNHFNIGALMEKGVRFIGNGQAPVHLYWEEILHDYIMTGKFDVGFMISHRVDLEDFPQLYDKFDRRVAGVEKVFVQTKARCVLCLSSP